MLKNRKTPTHSDESDVEDGVDVLDDHDERVDSGEESNLFAAAMEDDREDEEGGSAIHEVNNYEELFDDDGDGDALEEEYADEGAKIAAERKFFDRDMKNKLKEAMAKIMEANQFAREFDVSTQFIGN